MEKFSNDLSNAELERLALLSEEMGEAIQSVGKIIRHGYESYNPDEPNSVQNRTYLKLELGHVLAAIEMMCHAGDVFRQDIYDSREKKLKSIKKWLHHQPE